MGLLDALSKVNYKKAALDALKDTGQFAQAISTPFQGPVNAVRDFGVIAGGGADALKNKTSFSQGVQDANQAVPPARFGSNAIQAMASQGKIPKPLAGPVSYGGELAGSLAIPGLQEVGAFEKINALAPKLAKYAALRGLEGAARGTVSGLAQDGTAETAEKQGMIGALAAFGGNLLLSPKAAANSAADAGERSNVRQALSLFGSPYEERATEKLHLRDPEGTFRQGAVKVNTYGNARPVTMGNAEAFDALRGSKGPSVRAYAAGTVPPEGESTLVYGPDGKTLQSVMAGQEFQKFLKGYASNR